MKFLHLSDLHIGKKLNGFSLLEDQIYILNQALALIDKYAVDAVIIAGDVYDSKLPPTSAVTVLDRFLTDILKKKKPLFIASGNHDSPERLSFASEIMKEEGLYIEGIFKGAPSVVTLQDCYGKINVHMLPFVNPAIVNAFYREATETFDEAVRFVLSKVKAEADARNILIAHQFVTSAGKLPEQSDSELKYAGGIDNVDCAAFNSFDYVALGHLHCPQKVGKDTIVYGGSPLKYSVSERHQKKCAVIVDVGPKGTVDIQKIPLEPLRDLRQIKGPLETLTCQQKGDDYISVVLTGGMRHIDPLKRLRAVYRNCISVEYEDTSNADSFDQFSPPDISQKDCLEIFEQFYFERNNENFDSETKSYLTEIIDELSDGGVK